MIAGSLLLVAVATLPVATESSTAEARQDSVNARAGRIMESILRAPIPPPQLTQSQQEMSDALDRKSAAKQKMVGGAVAAVVGIVGGLMWPTECPDDFFLTDDLSCNQRSGTAKLGFVVGAAGLGVFAWGVAENAAANGTISGLTAQGGQPGKAVKIALSSNQFVTIRLARRANISYGFRW